MDLFIAIGSLSYEEGWKFIIERKSKAKVVTR